MKLKKRYLLFIVSIAISGVASWYLDTNEIKTVMSYAEETATPIATTIQEEPEEKVVIDTALVEEKLSMLWELSTVKYAYSGASSFSSSKQLNSVKLPFTTKSFVMTYDGYIKAGIDLSSMTLVIVDDVVRIELDQPIIFDNVIDESSIKIVDENKNVFNMLEVQDVTNLLAAEKIKMSQRAMKNGLIDNAKRNAELVIRSTISMLELDCTVTFKE